MYFHRCLYERLVYVTCFQNWEGMNEHYWIKQVIQVINYLVFILLLFEILLHNILRNELII